MSVKITMIGTGYVGLVTGACLAELGHDVICCDTDTRKIDMLERGEMPIYEPGLEELVRHNVERDRLRFSTDLPASVKDRSAIFICVGTPPNGIDGQADVSYVSAAAAEVAVNLEKKASIIIKSTVPVGTNRMVANVVKQHIRPGVGVSFVSNPEFLREGNAINDFMQPDRILIGADDESAVALMKRIYAPLVETDHPLIVTSIETAELTKYAANAFLAVKLSFINEMADLCEAVGADVEDLATGIGADARIAPAFLKVGPGWGGSCFPKDTRALAATAAQNNLPLRIVNAAVEANECRKRAIVERIELVCGGSVAGKALSVLGLTFKGQTDDMRESPSLEVLPSLVAKGAKICAFDPSVTPQTSFSMNGVSIAGDPVDACIDAEALVVLTDWNVFRTYEFADLARVMADPVMIDFRNLFDEQEVVRNGFRRYVSVGRASTMAHSEPVVPLLRQSA